MSDGNRYKVLVTPLIKSGVYGSTIDVTQDLDLSDWIVEGGLGEIKRELDEGDYQAANLFVFGELQIQGLNLSGKWSESTHWGSIFPYSRDLAKFDVYRVNTDLTETLVFKGLLNEEAIREDVANDIVNLSILGLDSILRKTFINSGTIATGATFSEAIKTILSRPQITDVLTYSASNVSVSLDLVIDDNSVLESINAWDSLKQILTASNSILKIDSTGTVFVSTRAHNGGSAVTFYGPNDLYGRENIISITNYNTGLHRAFNSISVNGQTAMDANLITTFGSRSASYTIACITDAAKSLAIAQELVDEFAAPKIELELQVSSISAIGLDLQDLIVVDYSPEARVPNGQQKLTIWGQFKWGSAKWNKQIGAFRISPKYAFKVIGIYENADDSITTLKLRQIGTTLSDGTIAASGASLWGGFSWGDGSVWG